MCDAEPPRSLRRQPPKSTFAVSLGSRVEHIGGACSRAGRWRIKSGSHGEVRPPTSINDQHRVRNHNITTRPPKRMHWTTLTSYLVAATAVSGFSVENHVSRHSGPAVPSLRVPACPDTGNVSYTNSVPSTDQDPFPETQVAVCYDELSIHIVFTALNETSFYCATHPFGHPHVLTIFPVNAPCLLTPFMMIIRQCQRSDQWRYL